MLIYRQKRLLDVHHSGQGMQGSDDFGIVQLPSDFPVSALTASLSEDLVKNHHNDTDSVYNSTSLSCLQTFREKKAREFLV